jgi:LEA14-like dessication related protein
MYIIVCWNSVIARDGRSNEQWVLKEGAENVEIKVDLDQEGRKEALERAIERSNTTTVFIEECSMLVNRKE